MKQTFNLLKAYHSRLQFIAVAFFISLCVSQVKAQITKIDFNSSHNWTYAGYEGWYNADVNMGSSISYTSSETGVTLTLSHVNSTIIDGVTKTSQAQILNFDNGGKPNGDSEKLTIDGICPKMNGKDYEISSIFENGRTTEMVGINVTISGLSAGKHSVQAYHNFLKNPNGYSLPTIAVAVNGVTVLSGIEQSNNQRISWNANYSWVEFETNGSEDVTLTYYSEVESGVTYATTYFYINSLEIDLASPADFQVKNQTPANEDRHVQVNNGQITFSWEAANAAAEETTHTFDVYFGDSESQVQNAESSDYYHISDLSVTRGCNNPFHTYYWRVDEIIDGVTYKGNVLSFQPGRLAFPGAEGYGRFAIGGRGIDESGGSVYHVTSLEDYNDGESPIEGTFRYGIREVTGPRTIVFDIGGVIHLKNRLTCSDPYVTIAGQTAPGNGIMFRGAPFGMASDGITRFLRLRRGHIVIDGNTVQIKLKDDNNNEYYKTVPADSQKGMDGMGMAGNDHSIMDHCSISWTIDEGFSSRGAKHITLQNTLISNSLNIAGHVNYDEGTEHGYAATIGGGEYGAKGSSFHHNLLAHNEGRNWSISGGLNNGYYDGHHDIYNNVCYNYATRATDGGTHEGNFVNNYYKKGPSTSSDLGNYIFNAQLENHGHDANDYQSYYVNGNYCVSQNGNTETTGTSTYKYTLSNGQTEPTTWSVFQNNPWSFWSEETNVESAKAAYKNVLSDVGCNQPVLDNHDTRMVTETKNGTYTFTGTKSLAKGRYGHIDHEDDIVINNKKGFETLNIVTETREADWDTDGDGIPNWFETAKGWDENSANNNVYNSEFYTNLEEYLNWMAEPHWIKQEVDEPVEIDLSTYFAGYSNPSYTINADEDIFSWSISNSTLTITPKESGLLSFTVKATENGISLTRTFNFHVNGQPNVYNQAIDYSSSYTNSYYGNITWPLNTGGSNQTATVQFYNDNVNSKFTVEDITIGDQLTISEVDNKLGMTKFKTLTNEAEAKDNNRIQFYVSLADGYTFTPTSISVTASKFGTNGGCFDISWYANGSSTKIATGLTPARAATNGNYNNPAFTSYNFNISDNQNLTGLFGIKLNFYNVKEKEYGFKDIIINGTVTETITNEQRQITLKETATKFLPFMNGGEKVFKESDFPIRNATVTLERTLSNSFWNSFCVPFDITTDQINEIFGGGEVLEFESGTRSSVTFKTVTTGITAGKPCLFKPTNIVSNPTFNNVDIDISQEEKVYAGADNNYSFDGHFASYDMKTDKSEYFLSTDGKLYYPNQGQNHLLGMRATFTFPSSVSPQNMKMLIIDEEMVSEGPDVVDGLQTIDGGYMIPQPVFNLNGQKVGTTRSKLNKGVYIVNGKKVIIQ